MYKLFVVCVFAAVALAVCDPRTVTFVNNCESEIWIGFVGGFTQTCAAGGVCPAGQGCNPNSNQCHWVLPPSPTGSYRLDPGQQISFDLPVSPGNVQLSGSFYGKTGCDANGENCLTGECGTCLPGVGPLAPVTLALTTLASSVDGYSISFIQGVNVPMSIQPTAGQFFPPNLQPYWCGNPGEAIATSPELLGCCWDFTDLLASEHNTYLRAVTPGGAACTSDASCSGGQICGLNSAYTRTCGNMIGFYSASTICGANPTFGAPFNCAAAVPGQGTNFNLYLCDAPNTISCYEYNAPSTCCGCPYWEVDGSPLVENYPCTNTNSEWEKVALPFAALFKEGCATAEAYPGDDSTSDFLCSSSSGGTNTLDYTVTFCPAGCVCEDWKKGVIHKL